MNFACDASYVYHKVETEMEIDMLLYYVEIINYK